MLKAVPYKKYRVVRTETWDAGEAVGRMRTWAGGPDKDKMDWGRYREGFGTYDADAPADFGSYGYPHHDIVDGELVTVTAGLSAAMAFLERGDMEEETRTALRNHLARHYQDADMEMPGEREAADMSYTELFDALKHSRMSPVTTRAFWPELPEADPMRLRFKESLPDVEEAFLFELHPTNQALDAYGTRMTKEVLDTYRRNALAGVPFLNSHISTEMPLGYSYYGELRGLPVEQGALLERGYIPKPTEVNLFDPGQSLVTWDYMLPGHYPNGQSRPGTDDVIKSIRGRTLRDISIGFGNDIPTRLEYRCGLTGKRMGPHRGDDERYSPYIPLLKDRETGLIAFAWVYNARMVEHSGVWKGATPGAIVGQARSVARDLTGEEREFLEDLWEVPLCPERTSIAVKKVEDKAMADEVQEEKRVEVESVAGLDEARVVELLEARLIEYQPDLQPALQRVEQLAGVIDGLDAGLKELRGMVQKLVDSTNRRLDEQAALFAGQQVQREQDILKQLQEEVIRARIRAFGQDPEIESYRERIAGLTAEQLRAEIKDNERMVTSLLQAGRQITPDAPARKPGHVAGMYRNV